MRSNAIRTKRRTELTIAAFEIVMDYGLRRTTLDKVGDKAGLSKGVVLHHLKVKASSLRQYFEDQTPFLVNRL